MMQGGGECPAANKIGAGPAAPLPDHGICLPISLNAKADGCARLARGRAKTDVGAMQDRLDSICAQVLQHAVSPYYESPVPRLVVATQCAPTSGVATVYEPVTCLILPTDIQDFSATDPDFSKTHMSDEDIERAIADIKAALNRYHHGKK